MKRKHEEIVADDGNNIKVEESSKSAKKNVNKIPPYDANKEPLPNCKTFTQEFEDLTTEAQEITDLLLAPFKANPYRNDVLEGLFEEIQRRTSANTPERHKIALVGEMKAGKSMVINSILGMGLLARSVRAELYVPIRSGIANF